MLLRFAHAHQVTVWPPSPLAQARLNQCLALAVLLHILLVILFGTAPGGTAKPGEGVWGRINVTLRGVAGQGTPSEIAVSPNTVETGPAGKAERQQRFGGAVRTEPQPPAPTEPGAAQLGRFNQEPTAALNDPVPEAKMMQAPAESASVERVQKVTPLAAPGAATESLAPLPAQRAITVPRLASTESSVERVQRSGPALSAPSPAAESVQALPTQRAVTVPRLAEAEHAGIERVQKAPALAPAVPGRAPDLVQSLPTQPAIEAPAPPLSTLQAPAETSAPVTPLQAQKLTPLAPNAPSTLTPGGVPKLPPAGEIPRGDAQAAGTAPKAVGAPDAGSRLGHDVATAPSASASAPKAPLDLRLPKGGELARRQGPGSVFQMMPAPPEKKSKLAEDMEKAAREDCRTAHSGAGLLAPLVIAADTVRGKGCKW